MKVFYDNLCSEKSWDWIQYKYKCILLVKVWKCEVNTQNLLNTVRESEFVAIGTTMDIMAICAESKNMVCYADFNKRFKMCIWEGEGALNLN